MPANVPTYGSGRCMTGSSGTDTSFSPAPGRRHRLPAWSALAGDLPPCSPPAGHRRDPTSPGFPRSSPVPPQAAITTPLHPASLGAHHTHGRSRGSDVGRSVGGSAERCPRHRVSPARSFAGDPDGSSAVHAAGTARRALTFCRRLAVDAARPVRAPRSPRFAFVYGELLCGGSSVGRAARAHAPSVDRRYCGGRSGAAAGRAASRRSAPPLPPCRQHRAAARADANVAPSGQSRVRRSLCILIGRRKLLVDAAPPVRPHRPPAPDRRARRQSHQEPSAPADNDSCQAAHLRHHLGRVAIRRRRRRQAAQEASVSRAHRPQTCSDSGSVRCRFLIGTDQSMPPTGGGGGGAGERLHSGWL